MSYASVDQKIASRALHHKPFPVRHTLAGHRLFTLPRLIELAQKMPRDKIEYNAGDLEPGQTAETTPRLDMTPGEVISRIENHNAWMVIKHVHLVPAYNDILTSFLDDAFAACGMSGQPYSHLEGFVFVSSANATTPFHVDAEENILVQIRGKKTVHIFDNDDRALVSEENMEISPSRYRNQTYHASYEERASIFHLEPGDGVHIPYLAPHWVHTGEDYSVSMAMTWKTPRVERLNKIRLMNGTLRHYGFAQKPPGVSPVMDQLKVAVHDGARMIIDPLRKSETARRVLRRVLYGKKANYYYDNSPERSGN